MLKDFLIYALINKITGIIFYVGLTFRDPYKRLLEEFRLARNGVNLPINLYLKDMDLNDVEIVILENCGKITKSEGHVRENFYINFYETNVNGCNREVTVSKWSLQGEFLEKYSNQKEASEKNKIFPSQLSISCSRGWPAKGFLWTVGNNVPNTNNQSKYQYKIKESNNTKEKLNNSLTDLYSYGNNTYKLLEVR